MCHAIPAEVIEILPGDRARVEFAGVAKEISTELLEDVTVGDWVIVHVGYALSKMDVREAERTLAALAELNNAMAPEDVGVTE